MMPEVMGDFSFTTTTNILGFADKRCQSQPIYVNTTMEKLALTTQKGNCVAKKNLFTETRQQARSGLISVPPVTE